MRRVSLRRGSLRRGSLRRTSLVPASNGQDLPWDILDRLLIPIICCHAAAIILSGILNVLHISDVSTLALFAWFALSTGGAILFYHHLKVSFEELLLLILAIFSIITLIVKRPRFYLPQYLIHVQNVCAMSNKCSANI